MSQMDAPTQRELGRVLKNVFTVNLRLHIDFNEFIGE